MDASWRKKASISRCHCSVWLTQSERRMEFLPVRLFMTLDTTISWKGLLGHHDITFVSTAALMIAHPRDPPLTWFTRFGSFSFLSFQPVKEQLRKPSFKCLDTVVCIFTRADYSLTAEQIYPHRCFVMSVHRWNYVYTQLEFRISVLLWRKGQAQIENCLVISRDTSGGRSHDFVGRRNIRSYELLNFFKKYSFRNFQNGFFSVTLFLIQIKANKFISIMKRWVHDGGSTGCLLVASH